MLLARVQAPRPHRAASAVGQPESARLRAAARSGGRSERHSRSVPSGGTGSARRALWRNWRPRPRSSRAAIVAVARQRMADRGEVGPDLVGAPGLEPHAHERVLAGEALDLEVGARLARPVGARGHARAVGARSRPSGASIVPVRDARLPGRERQVLAHDLAPRAAPPAARRWAGSPFATSISPDVSRSRRCTACGSQPRPRAARATRRASRRGGPAPGAPRSRRACRPPRTYSSSHTIARLGVRLAAPAAGAASSIRTVSPPRRRVPFDCAAAVDQHGAGVDQPRRRRARDAQRLCEPGVEPRAGRRGGHLELTCAPSPSSGASSAYTSSATPTTIADVGDVERGPERRVDEVDRGADPDPVGEVAERAADHEPGRQPQVRRGSRVRRSIRRASRARRASAPAPPRRSRRSAARMRSRRCARSRS